MPDYSLAELARLADVTPRTVRYYVAQGLLPSPDAAGPATRYGEGHLARLRLIRRLQREHLPLAEIRARLEGLTEEAIEALVEQPAPADMAPADALGYIHDLMGRTGLTPRVAQARIAQARPPAAQPPVAAHARAVVEPARPDEVPPPPSASPMGPSPAFPPTPLTPPPALAPPMRAPMANAPMPTPPPPPDRSTWERISLDPDVELHVRRPLDRATNKRVERLIRIARELFEDDPA